MLPRDSVLRKICIACLIQVDGGGLTTPGGGSGGRRIIITRRRRRRAIVLAGLFAAPVLQGFSVFLRYILRRYVFRNAAALIFPAVDKPGQFIG